MAVCDNPEVNCDTCFEVLIGDCLATIILSLGLTPSTLFFFRLIDKSGREYDFTATTDASGNFTIDKTQLPDDLINQFAGDFELQTYSDSNRAILVLIIQNSFFYNCVLLVQALSGQNQITPIQTFDSNTESYINAVESAGGSLSTIEKTAINIYILDSKNNADAWFSDTLADYPMLGGTANSCKINARNPGTFDGTFVNTVAGDFTSNGWTPNGTSSYMRTGLIPDTELTINSISLEYYSRTNVALNDIEMGARNSNLIILFYQVRGTGIAMAQCYSNQVGGIITASQSSSAGGNTLVRFSSTDMRLFKNGIQFGSTLTSTAGFQPLIEMWIGTINDNNTPSPQFTTKQTAGVGIFDGLTPAQVLAQYTARQAMNTTLGRQV